MGRRGRNSGWHRSYQLSQFNDPAPEPSAWELKLRELRINGDDHALRVLAKKSEKSLQLRLWIGTWCWRRYVPTRVLSALQLNVTVECRFPMD